MKKILVLSIVSLVLQSYTLFAQMLTTQEKLGYPKNTKLLIINADDFGLSQSQNAATIAAIEKGSVRSVSITVPAPWFPQAAAYAKAHPDKDWGVHVTLTSEWEQYKWGAISDQCKVRGLLNSDHFLYSSADSVALRASAAEVAEETRNQLLRAIRFGIDPTHLDTHMYTSLYGNEFTKAYLKIAHEFGIPAFLPPSWKRATLKTLISDKDVLIDSLFTLHPKDFDKGTDDFYTSTLRGLQPGLNYFIIHMATDNAEMQGITSNRKYWGSRWRQVEYDFFTSPQSLRVLKENNIQVITWKEIRDKISRK